MLVVGKFGRFTDAVSKMTTTFPVPCVPTQVISRWSVTPLSARKSFKNHIIQTVGHNFR